MRSEILVSAYLIPALISGVSVHSSFFGAVSMGSGAGGFGDEVPFDWGIEMLFGGLYDLACGDSVARNRVGADGLMDLAMSINPSVNTSAANLMSSLGSIVKMHANKLTLGQYDRRRPYAQS